MHRSLVLIALFAAGAATAQPARPPAPMPPLQVPAESMKWTAVRPPLPEGVQLAVLEGDPQKDGLYTIRLRIPAGTRLPQHWHQQHERVTVLSGMVELSFADDPGGEPKRLGAGSYYVNPPLNVHSMHFPEATELQLTGLGPWRTEFGENKAARATVSIRSVRPAAGTAVASDDEIVVEVDYSIDGFRPDMYNLSMQFDTTRPNASMGCVVSMVTTSPSAIPPSPPRLKKPAGTEVLTCRPGTLPGEVARPFRFRVFLIESKGENRGEPIAMSPYVYFK